MHMNTQYTYTQKYKHIPLLLLKTHECWHPTWIVESGKAVAGGMEWSDIVAEMK